MTRILFIIFVSISLWGCGSGRIYENSVEFENNSWQRFNILKWNFENTKVGRECDFKIKLLITEDVKWNFIPISFKIISPSDDERAQEHKFWIRNSDGELSGTKVGDCYEYSFDLRNNYLLNEKGIYGVSMENKMYKYHNYGFVKLELIVE